MIDARGITARLAGLLLLPLSIHAQPILIAPQQNQMFAGSSLSHLRVLKQSADGTETILTIDFIYDGLRGPTARLLPIIIDSKNAKIYGWFGADPVTISSGRGTISLKVRFFNDDPGVPPELTTDHIRIMMLADGGNGVISEGIFSAPIKWGNANVPPPLAAGSQTGNQVRLKAEEERRVADERAKADELAYQAQLKAEAEAAEQAHQAAVAKQLAEQKARDEAEAKAREARLKAEAEEKARQEAETKLLAEEKAKAEADAKAREEARLKAEEEEKARQEAEAKLIAEEKAKAEAEAKAREEARLKAEAEEKARQETEAKRLAEVKAKAEAEAVRLIAERTKAEAEARIREATAQRLAEEKAASSARNPVFVVSSSAKTKVTNLDVVNRNLDRTEMTIAVEYQFSKEDGPVRMGVDVASSADSTVSAYFSSALVNIGKGSRNFVMFPVKLDTVAAQGLKRSTLPTDKVWIYIVNAAGEKSYIFQGTMMLVWHIPGGGQASDTSWAQAARNTLEIESFKQNDLFSGYVTVKYNLRPAKGHLHLSVYDSANPATANWFESDDIPIKSGPGLQLVRIDVPKAATSPDVFNADTVEIQMLDANGTLLASSHNQSPMSWAKPK